MPVTAVTSLAEFNEIINRDEPAIFDFWAAWCGPCKLISPIYSMLSEQFDGMKFYKVDTDQAEDISHAVGIRAMPTFMVFRKGKKLGQVLGARPQEIKQLVETHNVIKA